MPKRWTTLLGIAMAGAWLAGCAAPEPLERRDGYVVDHTHVSPSHTSRVRHLVIHYTDVDEAESLAVLTGPHVSAHYVLPLPAREHRGQPRVYQLVDEERRAWHAGASAWKGRTDLNDTSIGVEIVNTGPDRPYAEVERLLEEAPEASVEIGWAPYPEAQIEALIALSRDIIERHDIHPTDVVAHSDIAPTRKIDPGPQFPWRQLHEAGIGVWPNEEAVARWQARFEAESVPLATLQQALRSWGYRLEATGELDRETRAVLRAFQMRFRPANYRGQPDAETAAILWALLETYRPLELERLEETAPE
ncbi:N-acetylmuramoyl-L-alanine amidase [Halomonas sp. MCCC 1A17488]|uniref:N-acetylmuramoyl-L-alanine amidase n=1 Tax=Billgrantia sulfidoxydans TaxID=2733484 RepID=A0ABX7W430_9GAMM|nr:MULTISPECIES: N-acetylmuramoyl-L-alanine amidase [Halomonas]MCE8015598.1 N-acetylmuramoyl-L-alanine amidase [Halomonas sp. MCCC 1A17488]MCG3238931.1 N-acetylmuramoyl-L-alanine amidase [Halomonas sp. MCCC 1A17488]QPP51115.1 N-acetylmuramoyl-L-alanine amidase [Halomonas sp. SS10-MC5]QTP54626.1 N-acetylmuramoyl-L-alanine amidase [Halomonas sulfidoxydans]